MPQIECKNLTLGYENIPVVRDLSFSVEKGDYLCIVGENGAGKSTLMKALLGLHKPMSGQIIRSDELNKGTIGYLPQQTDIQKDFPASVEEIVLSGCQGGSGFRPFYSKAQKARARICMEWLSIGGLRKSCYRNLSGGQQQRVLFARALAASGDLLVLDEPVTGLDPVVTGEMYNLIKHINKVHKVTIIMVTHDMEGALNNADHILHLGDQVFFGTVQDYLETEAGKGFASNAGTEISTEGSAN